MTLDERVRLLHEADRERADRLVTFMVDLPPKAVALRAIVDLLEEARFEGAEQPDLAREVHRRRVAREIEGPKPKGFAALPADERRIRSSMGGKAAQAKGTAHTWTSEEAAAAGRKGGSTTARRQWDRE